MNILSFADSIDNWDGRRSRTLRPMPHVEKHLPYNHPLVPLIAAGLTREGVSYREPYPAFLKAAIAGGHLFNKNDRHFSAAGHALFAKFLTDTEVALAAVDYYKQPH